MSKVTYVGQADQGLDRGALGQSALWPVYIRAQQIVVRRVSGWQEQEAAHGESYEAVGVTGSVFGSSI